MFSPISILGVGVVPCLPILGRLYYRKNHLPPCRSLQSESPSVQAPISQSLEGGTLPSNQVDCTKHESYRKKHPPPCSQSCNLTLHLYCLVLPPSTRGLCLVGGGGYIANLRRLVKFDTSLRVRLLDHHRSSVLHQKTNKKDLAFQSAFHCSYVNVNLHCL